MHTVRIVLGSGLALSGISIACCFVFGRHLAPGNEGLLYGVLGGVADALKAILPLAITAAFVARQRPRALIGCALFAVFSLYSFASELGLYALSRDAVSSRTSADKAGYERLLNERQRVLDRLAELGKSIRLADAVRADIAGQKQLRAWSASKECTDATAPASRAFCADVEKLKGELAIAEEAERLRTKDADLGAVMRSTDAQSEALARFTGLTPATVRDALAFLVALLIELGSGLGLYAATASGKAPEGVPAAEVIAEAQAGEATAPAAKKAKKAAPVEQEDALTAFLGTGIRAAEGVEIGAGELHGAYAEWIAAHGQHEPVLSSVLFGRKLVELGYAKEKRGGKIRWQGVALAGLRLVKAA